MQIENNPLWRAGKHPLVWGCLLLTAATLLNNWPMAAFGFAWDDHGYVVRNYPIQDPVSLKSLLWCLTAFAEANWHPLTWLTLHLEFQLFGLNPGGYHLVNLLLHLANTLLLFALLYRPTRAVGKSLFVAALFSVHPLHIESVAWISEVKDVLSTFFLLLTLHAYASYARRPNGWRYALVGLLLALGLASKPMLVTAPFILALLDFWPLGRWAAGPQAAFPDAAGPRFPARRLILEKLPLLAMSAAVCVLTFLAQREGGALAGLSGVTLLMRLGNASNSYIVYIWRMVWPWPLSFFYPYTPIPLWRVLMCLGTLAALCMLTWKQRRRRPFLLFGWLWYLGSLVPVIGLIQVGAQAMADRYTYIPLIGIFVAIAWVADDLRKRLRMSMLLPTTLSVATLSVFMCVSLSYLLRWINEEELYSYAIEVDEKNTVALNNYAILLLMKNDISGAISFFQKSIALSPNSFKSVSNVTDAYIGKGDIKKAFGYALKLLKTHPNNEDPYRLLGQCLYQMRYDDAAENMFQKALAIEPSKNRTIALLSDIYLRNRRYNDAVTLIEKQLPNVHDKDPHKAVLLWYAGKGYLRQGKYEESKATLEKILTLQPLAPIARQALARVAMAQNDPARAVAELKASLKQYPNDPATQALLGICYLSQGLHGKAYVQLKRALSNPKAIDPDDTLDTLLAMASLTQRMGQENAASLHAARAHDLRTLLSPRASKELMGQIHTEENGEYINTSLPEALAKTLR
jgi:tetratricopeptide (TPR) repeat protein